MKAPIVQYPREIGLVSQAPLVGLAHKASRSWFAGPVLLAVLEAGCMAASPATASLKDLNVPAMVGPARPGPQRTPAMATINAEIRSSYSDSPMVMRPGNAYTDNPAALAWAVHKAAPQCTDCTVAISSIPVGSYTTALPTDFFFWYSKNWCGIEASAYNRGPGTSPVAVGSETERR